MKGGPKMTITFNLLSNKDISHDFNTGLPLKKIKVKVFRTIGPYSYSIISADTTAEIFLESLGFRGEKFLLRHGGFEFMGNERIFENLKDGSIIFIVPKMNGESIHCI